MNGFGKEMGWPLLSLEAVVRLRRLCELLSSRQTALPKGCLREKIGAGEYESFMVREVADQSASSRQRVTLLLIRPRRTASGCGERTD